jgi:hypothetical protein
LRTTAASADMGAISRSFFNSFLMRTVASLDSLIWPTFSSSSANSFLNSSRSPASLWAASLSALRICSSWRFSIWRRARVRNLR